MMSGRDSRDRLWLKDREIVNCRYRIMHSIGSGTFSNVYAAVDLRNGEQVVIKAFRNGNDYPEAAQSEDDIMSLLSKLDKEHKFFVRYITSFNYERHKCIVTERLGPSLLEALEKNSFKVFPIKEIRSIIQQLLSAVNILHENNIIHTDLKLENVLFCRKLDGEDSSHDQIRLIDFGSSERGTTVHRHLVTTRQYRPPEILMGLTWTFPCDIWSLGCILIELALGKLPFCFSRHLLDHLFLIQILVGRIPKKMWDATTESQLQPFVKTGLIRARDLEEKLSMPRHLMRELKEQLAFDEALADLALLMLNPDPDLRPRAGSLLGHKFFQGTM